MSNNDLFLRTMKKLQENKKSNYKARILKESEEPLEGEEQDIITVVDPDLSTDEFKEKQAEIEKIIENTPEGEIVVNTEYVGMKIYTCPICLSNFYSETQMAEEQHCPVCFEVPEEFIYLGVIEQSETKEDTKSLEKAEQELDDTIENEEDEEYVLVDDEEIEDEKEIIADSKNIELNGNVISEDIDLIPNEIIEVEPIEFTLDDIYNQLNSAESIDNIKEIIVVIPDEELQNVANLALDNCAGQELDIPYVANSISEALKAKALNESKSLNNIAEIEYEDNKEYYDNLIKDNNEESFVNKIIFELAFDLDLKEEDAKQVSTEIYNLALETAGKLEELNEEIEDDFEDFSDLNNSDIADKIISNFEEITNIPVKEIFNYDKSIEGIFNDENVDKSAGYILDYLGEHGINDIRKDEILYVLDDKLGELYQQYIPNDLSESKSDDLVNRDNEFKQAMLSRLESDCRYFLGNGNRSESQLYSKNVKEHIQLMKDLYNSFAENEKPNWISMNDIENYEKEMI